MAKFDQIESAVVSLDKQVKVLTADLQKLITTVNSNSKSQTDLTNKTKAVTKATTQISAVEKELDSIRKRSAKTTKETIAAREQLRQKTKALTDAERKQQGTLKKGGGLFRSMTKSILAAGAAMFGLRAAFNVIKDGLKNIIAFEKAMSEVKAITGATAKEFKALKSNAALLGSTTAKTAIEVAGLQKEFAKLGFSTAEILAATEATINLSIAAGSDLAESAVVAASTIRGFGLSATESTRVVDVMAKSFTSSALDLEKFKIAMAKVAPVAKASGKTLEFATAQLATLSDAGLDASTAGTSLRNIFLELNKQGLTWEEGLEKINNSTNKNVTALNLFGKRGATAGLILADNTAKTGELELAFDNAAGSAKEMADVMNDNLAGDITKAQSAWEGLILSLNKGNGVISNSLRAITQLGTQALTVISSLGVLITRTSKLTDEEAARILTTFSTVSIGVSEDIKNAYEDIKNATKNEVMPAMKELEQALIDQGFSQEKAARIAIVAAQARANELVASAKAAKEAEITTAEEAARVKEAIAQEEAEKLLKLIEKTDAEILARTEKSIADRQALADKLVDEEIELADEELERLAKQLDDEYKLQLEADKRELEALKGKEDLKKEIKESALDASGQIVTDRLTAGIENDIAILSEAKDAEQKILDDKLDKGLISEKEFKKKSAALDLKFRQDEAKASKKAAIFEIAIATLVAVAKAGFITPAAIAAGAAGALSGVVAAAKPIPKFKHGSNGQLQLDTTAIVGDGGKPELITTPKGDFLSPSTDTMVHLPRGSQVFGGDSPETQAALSGGMSDEHYNGLIAEQRLTRKAIQAKSTQPIISEKGLERIDSNKKQRTNYLDRNFR